jgi:hypothetical protein
VPNIALLDKQAHRTLRVQPGASAKYGDAQRFVPVVIAEFPPLALHYPILFSKDSETGALYCGAVLGFDPDENLFLEDGKAYEAYRPLNLQRGCFYTSAENLAIDLDSPRIDPSDGQPLFSESGEPSPYLQSIMALMRELKPGAEQSRQFIETLIKLKLIVPVSISVSFDDGTKRELTGLYSIEQQTLRSLPDADAVDLFRRGYLYLIDLMVLSLRHVPALVQRKNRRLLQRRT